MELIELMLDRSYPAVPTSTTRSSMSATSRRPTSPRCSEPAVDGGRYLIGNPDVSMREFARVLADQYNPKGYRSRGRVPELVARVAARFDKSAALAVNDVANPVDIDAGPAIKLLGHPLRGCRR